jgi:putative ABC transport system permease protein
VAIVNDALVRRYFPHEDPLGKHIRFSGAKERDPWLTVVGVARNEKQSSAFHEMAWVEPPIVYRALAQNAPAVVDLAVRVSSTQVLSGTAIQKEITKLAPDLRVSNIYPMQHFVDEYTAQPKFRSVLMGAFAGLALVLAIVGLYGVLAQLVAQRTQEIGIRMALGAQQTDVLGMILKQGMMLAGSGAGLGLLATLWLARFLESLLYGVSPEDPATLGGVGVTLMLAALLATYIPARRAARVNPLKSLRNE